MESASPSPEPRHVHPGSLMKWDPRRRVWNPGLLGALSENGGGAGPQPHPPGHTCSPALCLRNQLGVRLLGGTFGVETACGRSGA